MAENYAALYLLRTSVPAKQYQNTIHSPWIFKRLNETHCKRRMCPCLLLITCAQTLFSGDSSHWAITFHIRNPPHPAPAPRPSVEGFDTSRTENTTL